MLWSILKQFNISILFAHRTFRWDSEANIKAHVHCVIVGFAGAKVVSDIKSKLLISEDGNIDCVDHINEYLVNAADVSIASTNKPRCNAPSMIAPNKPCDYNNLKIEECELDSFKKGDPYSLHWIKQMMGAYEFINNKQLNPESYLMLPCVSSERRKYIPIGFLNSNIIPVMGTLIIPDAELYHFGVLESNVHMAWVRTVCGRLEMSYRYSKDIVYNNFPWPGCGADGAGEPEPEQRDEIEHTAQGILYARALYPNSSLADLYDPLTMPPELVRAHRDNDRAVMTTYGIKKGDPEYSSESACVAFLMKRYQEMIR